MCVSLKSGQLPDLNDMPTNMDYGLLWKILTKYIPIIIQYKKNQHIK